jgi:hypothetical protein
MTPQRHSARLFMSSVSALPLVLSLAACTPYKQPTEAPVALAGQDVVLAGAAVTLTLDGTASYDTDGDIVRYEWRYSGWPMSYLPTAADGGALPTDPTLDPLAQPPAFCLGDEYLPDSPVQVRYCLVARSAQATLSLPPGGYRFTLYVEDDDGNFGGDTLDVLVTP